MASASVVLTSDTSGSVTVTVPSGTALGTTTLTLPTSGGTIQTSGSGFTTNGVAYASSTSALITGTGLQFDGTNLGVGVTPSAWNASSTYFKAIQFGTNGSVFGLAGTAGALYASAVIGSNVYYDGTNYKAIISDWSARYQQFQGNHTWYSSTGTVTSGNNITYTQAMTLDSSGNLLVGTTSSPSYGSKLRVQGGIEMQGATQFNIVSTSGVTDFEWVLRTGRAMNYYVNNASVIGYLSSTGVWTNASDARYKENIVDSQYGLSTVMALKPRLYNLIDQADKPQVGFIAQEVIDVVPEVVESTHNSVTGEDRYTLSYGNLVAVLTKAIQEQQSTIQSLIERITALEGART